MIEVGEQLIAAQQEEEHRSQSYRRHCTPENRAHWIQARRAVEVLAKTYQDAVRAFRDNAVEV